MYQGLLYPTSFIEDAITESELWKATPDDAVTAFMEKVRTLYEQFPTEGDPSEAITETQFIAPMLKALGWDYYLTQVRMSSSDRPDYLLFGEESAKQQALTQANDPDRYNYALTLLEAKRWYATLDRYDQQVRANPTGQLMNYLKTAEAITQGRIRWAMLTNGRVWRIYYRNARSIAEEFIGFDVQALLNLPEGGISLTPGIVLPPRHWFKVFLVLFGPRAFGTFGQGKLEEFVTESRNWEIRVTETLREDVFVNVFPQLMNALKNADPLRPKTYDEFINSDYLQRLRDETLLLLYRMLFVFYAEDRNLLPVDDPSYESYSVRKNIRNELRLKIDENKTFSKTQSFYYQILTTIFRAIDVGDEGIGLPAYNGGLFKSTLTPILTRAAIPDAAFAPLVDRLSRYANPETPNVRKWINYRDLSVQQLGTIYEGLLEFAPSVEQSEALDILMNTYARKTSGSYYTPQGVVTLIIQEAFEPFIQEATAAFYSTLETVKTRRSPLANKNETLAKIDPTEALLELKVCDPAMGSGHFLVSVVDWLSDRIFETLDNSEKQVIDNQTNVLYKSPLRKRIDDIRQRIFEQARIHGWRVLRHQLDDKQIIRRMVLKRNVYGVDKNSMAVELAKVALWLHTFTVGAPLSYLDHHIRHGDSLFGQWVGKTLLDLQKRGGLFIYDAINKAKPSAEAMEAVENLTDADISEVALSYEYHARVREATFDLDRFLQLYHAFLWLKLDDDKLKTVAGFMNEWLDGAYGNPVQIATETAEPTVPDINNGKQRYEKFLEILKQARAVAKHEAFFNWEVAFPTVWRHWESATRNGGGFDVIVSNPAWEVMKLQEIEFFAFHLPELSTITRGADRKINIQNLKTTHPKVWAKYEMEMTRRRRMAEMARTCGEYPTLAVGDLNYYTLFVERDFGLLKHTGILGILTPSGLVSDKTTSMFFQEISTSGRIKCAYDFENKKVFFPDVHASFKFMISVMCGTERRFPKIDMAFFLHQIEEIDEKRITLMPEDFRLFNPNTGTVPIFRTQRDVELTRKIYQRFPILHNHQTGVKVWPVKYHRMFDMTNDSRLFKRKEELEAEGYYLVEPNHFKKGKEEYVPLFEGKSINQYNHRYASIYSNPKNLKNPGKNIVSTVENLKDPLYSSTTQYWVLKSEIKNILSYYICFRDITNATNERTIISTILHTVGCGHPLPILLFEPVNQTNIALKSCYIVANLNSLALDYVARKKTQNTHLSWYILEQLPVISLEKYDEMLPNGDVTFGFVVKENVLRLCYTSIHLREFARDLGYEGEPFLWMDDEDEYKVGFKERENVRRHRMARLDALYLCFTAWMQRR